jgi:hypothetical protein
VVAKKKYDPLWEIVEEKVPLQGAEPDLDAVCPYCHVRVHLGSEAAPGRRFACGLCGGVSEVVTAAGGPGLVAVEKGRRSA